MPSNYQSRAYRSVHHFSYFKNTRGRILPVLLAGIAVILMCCHSANTKKANQTTDAVAPVLSPEGAIKAMQVEDGFTVKLVASEPLVSTPVAMNFDDSLRLWVVEMNDYMPDVEGDGEQLPTGRIVILEDKDGDGKMDASKVFMDSLLMPRAICLVDGGILVATPPNLWFIEIDKDHPGKNILVDSAYVTGGNPENQTSGLLRGIDNWIYSVGVNSDRRYRKVGNHWLTERTHLRGQWGISQDNYGHLFYNNNRQNLLGDYFMPGLGSNNILQRKVAGFDEKIVPDNRVYPKTATPVNRGYKEGEVDSNLQLINFTAACGPLIYRGGLFNKEYQGNAFVCEPAANLIKRNILEEKGYEIAGKQAYEGKEFLASTDMRFRPVNLYDGPDGALYLLDMYRGIIEHKSSLTNYLTKATHRLKMEQPINYGRIYKILPNGEKSSMVPMLHDPNSLVPLLKSANGWVRDRAQQILVDRNYTAAIPDLEKLLQQTDDPLATIHALWTLEGLKALKPADLIPLLTERDSHIRVQALSALTTVLDKSTSGKYIPVLKQLMSQRDSLIAPYIVYAINKLRKYDAVNANRLLDTLIASYDNNAFVTDAVISGIQGQESRFLQKFPDTTTRFHRLLQKTLHEEAANKKNINIKDLQKKYPEGYVIFNTLCQTCHGADGNGIPFLAPPFKNSNWVTGDKYKLVSIALFGLTGPVDVAGKKYKAPEITGEMPAIGNNEMYSDEAIAQLLSFLRNAWGNQSQGGNVRKEDVIRIRNQFRGREKPFTADELKELDF